MKKILIVLFFVFFIFLVLIVKKDESQTKPVLEANPILEIEIADTPEERIKGLSGRESLSENSGLLFVHSQPGIYGIWMKDMKFPIDVIWLDADFRVVDIAKDIKPDSFPRVFEPSQPALYILEVNAGFADKNQIKKGDVLKLF